MFRPDLLLPSNDGPSLSQTLSGRLDELPSRVDLREDTHALCRGTVLQMQQDAALDASAEDRNALMLHQLYALLLRLKTASGRPAGAGHISLAAVRVARLRALVDQNFLEHRGVAWYAAQLQCSPKTLTRACLAAAGSPAKALISERVTLEAKRLLVHSHRTVQDIGEHLGFDETSNFVKFFKREAGSTPARFRDGYSAGPTG